MDVIDLASLDKPTLRGSFFVDGYARDVAASSRFAFAVDAPTGLYVLDPARPGTDEAIGQVQSAAAPQMIEVMEQGGRVIACLVGGGALQLYDVTDPAKPVHLTSFKTPSGRPARIALDGTRGYVADGREGVQIVDLSNPSSPALVGGVKTSLPARDVAVGGGLVVAVVGMPDDGARPASQLVSTGTIAGDVRRGSHARRTSAAQAGRPSLGPLRSGPQ